MSGLHSDSPETRSAPASDKLRLLSEWRLAPAGTFTRATVSSSRPSRLGLECGLWVSLSGCSSTVSGGALFCDLWISPLI